jgi:alkylhydroperoxidase/carboxymuconolactone decarboxylase family protein YurZ
VDALSKDFEARLNYPQVTPASFNSEQLAFNASMNRKLKAPLPDMSPRQSCTREISLEEIEAMKRHIKAHGIDTAVGVDGFSYQDCMDIPNEKLLQFF